MFDFSQNLDFQYQIFFFPAFTQETSLIFDHSTEELKSTKALSATAESIMESLISKSSLSAQQNSAHEFTALVMALRKMNQKAMKPIWDKYFECKACSKDARIVYRYLILKHECFCFEKIYISFAKRQLRFNVYLTRV